MNQKPTITFKEIASLLDMSVSWVRSKEDKWKLREHRAKGYVRPVKFWREKALKALTTAGLIDKKLHPVT